MSIIEKKDNNWPDKLKGLRKQRQLNLLKPSDILPDKPCSIPITRRKPPYKSRKPPQRAGRSWSRSLEPYKQESRNRLHDIEADKYRQSKPADPEPGIGTDAGD